MSLILQPYFSIDIETTGLNIYESQVIQIGAVFDDGVSNLKDLPRIEILLKPETMYYEPFAMSMHSDLLKRIAKHENVGHEYQFSKFIRDLVPSGKVTFAGKNIGTFDLPILINNGIDIPEYKHRLIDVGSVYFNDFGYVPSLDEINAKIGYKPVTHTALEDALNVVYAIRHKVGIQS